MFGTTALKRQAMGLSGFLPLKGLGARIEIGMSGTELG